MKKVTVAFWLFLTSGILALGNGIFVFFTDTFGASGSLAVVMDSKEIGITHGITGLIFFISALFLKKGKNKVAGALGIIAGAVFLLTATLNSGFVWILGIIGSILCFLKDKEVAPQA